MTFLALSVASQRSRKEPKSAIIMEISDTDEDSAQTVKTTISRSKRSTSKRARGVNYDSDVSFKLFCTFESPKVCGDHRWE